MREAGDTALRVRGRRKERVDISVDDRWTDEAAGCRQLAESLNLDAVGVIRHRDRIRRITWWSAPGTGPLPLNVDDVLEGRCEGWIVCPHGDDLVFAKPSPRAAVSSVVALRSALSTLATDRPHGEPEASPRAEPQDPAGDERMRWAYAIHDGLTQVVTAAVLELEAMARRAAVEPTLAVEVLSEAADELRKALDEIRLMLAALSPEADQDEPLELVVQQVLERWRLPADWSIRGDVDALPGPVREAASSVIREGVANAAKHSDSKDVAVRVLATSDVMEIEVEDHGRGFRPTDEVRGHMGLDMMRKRVAEVRGTLDIESSPDGGTRVVARLPVAEQGDES